MWHERPANASAIHCRMAANAFTGMVKTTAATGKMHSSFGPIASSPAANLMHSKL
jgi:hypothetical protein